MKTYQECLREFEGLNKSEQSGYLVRHGRFLTDNALTFPSIPYPGATISVHAGDINSLYGLREMSEQAMKDYTDEVDLCVKMMEANYSNIDSVALGDGDIIALAGVKASSTNTARTAPPHTPENARYVFLDDEGEIQLVCNLDKLAWGTVIITFTDDSVKVEKTGKLQLKVTSGPADARIEIMIDLSTTVRTIIQHLKRGSKIKSELAFFNPNGLSPLVSPAPVYVPR